MMHLLQADKHLVSFIQSLIVCLFVSSITQLQNSRTVLQERDRAIRDLEEKVAFLEAEVRNFLKNANRLDH